MVADIFSSAVKRAVDRTLSVLELLGTANDLSAAGQHTLTSALYQTWIQHNGDSPLLYAIYFNYGVVLSAANDLPGARAALTEAIKLNPDFYPPYINLGSVLERMGAIGEAVTQWYELANRTRTVTGEAVGFKTTALKQVGRVLERARYDDHAEDALRRSLDVNADQSDVIQHWVSLRQRQCKWPVLLPFGAAERTRLLNGISALSLAAHTDDPMLQLANAYRYCKYNIGQPPVSFAATHGRLLEPRPNARRRVGYLSSDLREHAIGFLTVEIYGLHDRTKTEVFVYYCGIQVSDEIQDRVKQGAEHWFDINGMTDQAVAQRMIDDGIEILVDINGYTDGARLKMLAMRPAPAIVNWLGFPGSVGTPYHNYIIADDFIIPPENEIYYSEKVKRLPCYQPNDRQRVVSPNRPTRAAAGLPEDAIVYCCFNGLHKITPFTWRRWMQILAQVPGSVLWLLEGTEATGVRLREQAAAAGVAPERIVFTPRQRNPEHMARYLLADVFLDTAPYGAHTTCSDALWMGVPVVTLPGRCFASRVCGSLLNSAGLPDLICRDADDYVATAIDLGLDKARREAYRARLTVSRDSCVLFNTPLLVASLEQLYEEMWQEFKMGATPRPDLSNLEVYNDIGLDLDKDDVELLTVPDYADIYRQKLAEQDAYSYLRPDNRLWSGPEPQPSAVTVIPRRAAS